MMCPHGTMSPSMALRPYDGILCARYFDFYPILILNIKWPLAAILILNKLY
jgi:hypothetical protein